MSDLGINIELINETDLADDVVVSGLREQIPELAQINRVINGWTGTSRRKKNSNIFNQDFYSIPEGIFDQMQVASDAAKYDDVVSNAVETTEQLAFRRVKIECGDDDLNDIGEQILDNINLPQRMREIWRDLFIVSQSYVAVQWGRKSFKVRGQGDTGRNRKKVYKDILVPIAISTLDPLKIIPVGNFLFGNERLVYLADDQEALDIEKSIAGANKTDMNVNVLFDGKYTPTDQELEDIADLLGNRNSIGLGNRLFYLNQNNVWRITASRSSYQRFADVRMTSIFELLDLKHNLRESDRSDILGNLHCLVIVKKGTDEKPAKDEELRRVTEQFKSTGRNSIVISDHRLEVEIVSKKTQFTLQPERHNMLDSRITSRLYQTLNTGNYASGTAVDDSPKLFKVIAATMEARRDSIRESIMDHVIKVVWDRNEDLKGDPDLYFQPRRISLDFDPNVASLMSDLHGTGAISTETMLDAIDLDVEDEAYRREREDRLYGDILTPKLLPGQGLSPAQEGRIGGGNSNGGGMNSSSQKPSPSDAPKDPNKNEKNKAKAP